MSKALEPGKLKVKEAFLTRFLSNGEDDQQAVALAFVLTLRGNPQEAREKSDNAHRQAFELWLWDVEQDEILDIINEYGFGAKETDEDEEVKKD